MKMSNNINKFLWQHRYATQRFDYEKDGRYIGHIVGNNKNKEVDQCEITYGFYGYVDSYKRINNFEQLWTIWWPQKNNNGYFTGTCLTDNKNYENIELAKTALEEILKGQ